MEALITSGPYGWVRHPFYLTVLLLLMSASLIAANWLIGLSSIFIEDLRRPREPGAAVRVRRERVGQDL